MFRKESMSALLCCLSLTPLTLLLNECYGQQLSHLVYMDSLKRFSKSTVDKRKFIKLVQTFSNDIRMIKTLDKYVRFTREDANKSTLKTLYLISTLENQITTAHAKISKQTKQLKLNTTKGKIEGGYYIRDRLVLGPRNHC